MNLRHVPSKVEIGKAIKAARLRKKLSQDDLAGHVGAKGGRFTVIDWEHGLHAPTEPLRSRLASELGLAVEQLTVDEQPSLTELAERVARWDADGREIRAALEEALRLQDDDESNSG